MKDKQEFCDHPNKENENKKCPHCGRVLNENFSADSKVTITEIYKQESENKLSAFFIQSSSNKSKKNSKNIFINEINDFSRQTIEITPFSNLNFPEEIYFEAENIFNKASERDLVRGRSSELIKAACLYLACRNTEFPRTIREIAMTLELSPKSLSRVIRVLLKEIENNMHPFETTNHLIHRICENLNLSANTVALALNIFENAQREGATLGKNPLGVAAASVYAAGQINNEKITQNRIAEIANVTEVTVRNRLKEIIEINGLSKYFE